MTGDEPATYSQALKKDTAKMFPEIIAGLDIDHPFADKPQDKQTKKGDDDDEDEDDDLKEQSPIAAAAKAGGSVVDEQEAEEEDENAGYMEQEEIVIKKGKKLKQVKQIKLREYNIQQPDYALTPQSTLVYHQERITMIHEESCQSRVKTIPGDLLPGEIVDTLAANGKESEESKQSNGTAKPVLTKPQTLQIDAPLITPEQLFDFQITQVRIF